MLYFSLPQYAVWTVLSIGLNTVVVLIYNDIGLLAQVSLAGCEGLQN